MNYRKWLDELKEVFEAVTAGAQFVPLGDNGQAQHSLAVRLAELRVAARAGRLGGRVRRTTASAEPD